MVVGSAATLEVSPGVDYAATIELPDAWKPLIAAQRRAMALVQAIASPRVEWTYVSPPLRMEPGDRTGAYRTGGAQLGDDSAGRGVSTEDFAVALMDEVEQGRYVGGRMSVHAA